MISCTLQSLPLFPLFVVDSLGPFFSFVPCSLAHVSYCLWHTNVSFLCRPCWRINMCYEVKRLLKAHIESEDATEKHRKGLPSWSKWTKTLFVAVGIRSWFWPIFVTVCPLSVRLVNPLCTPLVHFLWPPPSHLSNGRIVLMDCPKQQRGRHSCHSTFTPPLHSYPLHPSVCNRSGNMHFFLKLSFVLSPRQPPLVWKETLSLGLTK